MSQYISMSGWHLGDPRDSPLESKVRAVFSCGCMCVHKSQKGKHVHNQGERASVVIGQ